MAVQRRRLTDKKQPYVGEEQEFEPVRASEPEVEAVSKRGPMRATRTDERDAGRDPQHKPARTRRRNANTAGQDMFFIPVEEIPEGLSYEWKRWSNVGQEDPFYIASLREQGWEPVNPKAHPNWLPPGYTQPHIIKGGQILMERPIELTQEARTENRQLARRQMTEAEQRLGMTPKDTLTRDHRDLGNRVVKEIGRYVPIEE